MFAPDDQIDSPRGRCRLWWSDAPAVSGRRAGYIGGFHADEQAAAVALLNDARDRLRRAGCELAVGPVDGSTWADYRLVTDERGDLAAPEPPFPLEPANPLAWPAWWRSAGFAELATYRSTVNERIAEPDELVEYAAARVDVGGLALRPLDTADFQGELRRAHGVCDAAFAGNFLFRPLGGDAFVALMNKAKPLARPGLVWLAEHDSAGVVGFCFAYPAPASPGTVVLKSLAARPGPRWAGVGTLLMRRLYASAVDLDYARAISALVHDANRASLKLYRGRMTTIRRYAVFSRPL